MRRNQPGGVETAQLDTGQGSSGWNEFAWSGNKTLAAAMGLAVFSLSACGSNPPDNRTEAPYSSSDNQGTGGRGTGEIPNKKEHKTQEERTMEWEQVGLRKASFNEKTGTYTLTEAGMSSLKKQTSEQLADILEAVIDVGAEGSIKAVSAEDGGVREYYGAVSREGEHDAVRISTAYVSPSGGSEFAVLDYWLDDPTPSASLEDVVASLRSSEVNIDTIRREEGYQLAAQNYPGPVLTLQAWYGYNDPNSVTTNVLNNGTKKSSDRITASIFTRDNANADKGKRFWIDNNSRLPGSV